ncbi:O-antigen ligase family protein [Corticibacterium sp. UT-5YL-CI-8]|nr:O-antigen ligase family protein [Tianweitania sp. UT-5YL-CI-8]
MAEHHRAFLYVLLLGLPALYVAARALSSLVDEQELKLWCGAWIISTAALFLTGSILLYTAAICVLSVYVHRVSKAPFLFYLILLLTAPAVGVNLGIPGLIGSIIELTPGRLFSLAFLLPSAIALRRGNNATALSGADKAFALFVIIVAVLSLRHGSPTHMLRACAVLLLDIMLPYYVFSRAPRTPEIIRWALAAIVFASLPFAMAGMFELLRGWRLYDSAILQWGVVLIQSYLFRDGMLRAAASSVEPISFGFACVVALGCLLAIRDRIKNVYLQMACFAVLCGGLVASLSRGPWLGAAVLLFVFVAARPKAVLTVAKAVTAASVVTVPVLLSPYGERIVRFLPFVGSVDTSNEDYRARLIDATFAIVGRNPLFGSTQYRFEPEMLAMIQGQGIIDVVNTYAAIALEYGLAGLIAFSLTMALAAAGLARLSFRSQSGSSTMVRAMLATLAAILLIIGTVSSVSVVPYIYWAFAGVSMAAARIKLDAGEATARPPVSPPLTVIGSLPISPFRR